MLGRAYDRQNLGLVGGMVSTSHSWSRALVFDWTISSEHRGFCFFFSFLHYSCLFVGSVRHTKLAVCQLLDTHK